MLRERGVEVDHTTLYRWVQRYAPELQKRLARYQSRLGAVGISVWEVIR
jgi:transposase, IS6 family